MQNEAALGAVFAVLESSTDCCVLLYSYWWEKAFLN